MKELNFSRVMFVDGQVWIEAYQGAVPLELYFDSAQEILDSCDKKEEI